ncbi:hypothetical protein D3C86_1911530 [compost metagenome]
MQAICEDGLLVGLTIVIGILKNDNLVVRLRIAGFVMRVAGHCSNPKAALIIERHLHWFRQVREFLLRGKKLNFIAFRHFQLRQCVVSVQVS